jgi:DNA-directed RNA polymerase
MTKPLTNEEVETMMHTLGTERYDAAVRRANEHGKATQTGAGNHLLRNAVEALSARLETWVAEAKKKPGPKHASVRFLDLVSPHVAALITAQIVLDQISQRRPYLSTATTIADAIEDEARFTAFKRDNPNLWEDALRFTSGLRNRPSRRASAIRKAVVKAEHRWQSWSPEDKMSLGIVCIELLAAETGLVEVKNIAIAGPKARLGKKAVIEATAETIDWISQSHEEHRTRFPFYLPVVTNPPEPWTSPTEGGYTHNVVMRWPLFRVPRKQLRDMTADVMPGVYSAVNHLQNTEWAINDNVFAVFDHLWAEGHAVAGLPARSEISLPPQPEGSSKTNPEEWRLWRREAAKIHTENSVARSSRAAVAKTHFVARHYQHQPFWFPYKLDFRGRAYPVPPFLNPQGTDLAKGLLRFSKALPIETPEARDWLAIHGANTFGMDKKPFAERLQWVRDNEAMIRACSADPISTGEWANADEPWQALAFCFEWDALLEAEAKGETFCSSLPVAMDGTNNGLQLFSLLLRDPSGASATNVTPGTTPRDIYQEVADVVTRKLEADVDSLEERTFKMQSGESGSINVATMARAWLAFVGGRVPRKATKRPVMVVPYSGTRFSCRDYIVEWYEDEIQARGLRDNRPFTFTWAYSSYLANIVWDAIQETVVGARAAMEWLREVSSICVEAGRPLRWTTPSGFRVHQSVHTSSELVIRTKIGKVLKARYARKETNTLSKRGNANGIAPNYIHSLDASVMTLTTNRAVADGVTSFAMVHDSYATHAAHAPTLARILRETVRDMFARDLLAEFRDEIAAGLPPEASAKIPALPKYGALDPSVVEHSPYFFA